MVWLIEALLGLTRLAIPHKVSSALTLILDGDCALVLFVELDVLPANGLTTAVEERVSGLSFLLCGVLAGLIIRAGAAE